jgi:hypothetical protein
MIATLPGGPQLVQEILTHLDQQRKINPSLLIPMDASAVDPRLRLYPATFRNPLPSTARAAITAQVLGRVAAQRSATTGSVRTPTLSTLRAFDPSAMLARVLRSLGYRGSLSPVWLRLASVAIALILALILTTGALAAARAIIRAIVPTQPTTTPASTAPTLVPAETFALSGPIEQIGPDSWLVNGMPIAIDTQTTITGAPAVGAVAHVRGILQDNGTLLARSISVDTVIAPSAAPAGVPTDSPPALALMSAPVAVVPTPVREPTALAATSAPLPAAPVPTAIPEPPVPTVAPEPPPAPAPSGDLFAQLRALLVAGAADGRTGEDGKELVKKFDEGQAAFASGDLQKTAEKLRELRQKVQEKTREGKMDGAFANQALGLIDAIANTYGLDVGANGGGGNDQGRGDDKGEEDKGKDDKKDKGN